MEARAWNSILDFETLFSDFQELLNGSGLTLGFCGLSSYCAPLVCVPDVLGVFAVLQHNKLEPNNKNQGPNISLIKLA